jgi:hypothetical protein
MSACSFSSSLIHQLTLNRTRLRRHHRPAADLMHPI